MKILNDHDRFLALYAGYAEKPRMLQRWAHDIASAVEHGDISWATRLGAQLSSVDFRAYLS